MSHCPRLVRLTADDLARRKVRQDRADAVARLMADPSVRAREFERTVARDAARRDHTACGTRATCDAAAEAGKAPHGTPEGYARIGWDGMPVGMYREAPRLSSGRAAGLSSDPFGRQARQHDATVRHGIAETQLDARLAQPPSDDTWTVPARVHVSQSAWAALLRDDAEGVDHE